MATKPHPQPFRLITTAPHDVAVEVLHGKSESVALARWDVDKQTWVRVGDPEHRALRRVIGWRPVR